MSTSKKGTIDTALGAFIHKIIHKAPTNVDKLVNKKLVLWKNTCVIE